MKITKINVKQVFKEKSRLKAYVNVVLDDCLEIRNIRIIQGKKDLFVVMPNKENFRMCPFCGNKTSWKDQYCKSCGKELSVMIPSVKFKDVVRPLTPDFARYFTSEILSAYKKHVVKDETNS